MRLAATITSCIDALYPRRIERFVSRRIFRYGVCGGANMLLDWLWYFVIYHFIVARRFIDLGFVVVSPHIASLAAVFPITFFTGFWLNRNVVFTDAAGTAPRQAGRYLLSVGGALLLNYICMKLFVEVCGVWATPAKMLTTVVSVTYSFLAAKYFTFRRQY